MATLTATMMSQAPKRNHTGTDTLVCTYDAATTSLSAGDIVQFFKIPNRAKIVGGSLFRATAGGDCTIKVGALAVMSSTGIGEVALNVAGRGHVVSITASNNTKFVIATLTAASATLSGTIILTISYTMDHPDSEDVST